jgi:hypothetical protein
MDRLRALSIYWDEYRTLATQHVNSRIARDWMESGVSAAQAAAWASQGYLPTEAAPLIAEGVTPQAAQDLDDIAEDVAGGREERALQVIDRLVADGTLVDPRRVRVQQDPNDGGHVLVHIDTDG